MPLLDLTPTAERPPSGWDTRTAAREVQRLEALAHGHRAIRSAGIRTLGSLPVAARRRGFATLATHHAAFAAALPHLIAEAVERLVEPMHRQCLVDELRLVEGRYLPSELAALAASGLDPALVDRQSRADQFERFRLAVGGGERPGPGAVAWCEALLRTIRAASPGEVLGAVGLGISLVAADATAPVLAALDGLDLEPEATAVFTVQMIGHPWRAVEFREAAVDVARSPEAVHDLEVGLQTVLSLRAGYLDWLQAEIVAAVYR